MKKSLIGVATVSAAMLAFGGTAWAAPKPPKPKAPKPNETITITIDAASPNGPSPVTASGVFNGSGNDTRTSRVAGKGAQRSVHAKDVLTFDTGTVTVKDSGVRRTTTDTTTCATTLNEKGIWKIVSGTGDFAHSKGHGHYKATGTIQGAVVTGGCDFSAPTGTITVTATGRVK
jgi:hypothetical protein